MLTIILDDDVDGFLDQINFFLGEDVPPNVLTTRQVGAYTSLVLLHVLKRSVLWPSSYSFDESDLSFSVAK